MSQISIHRDLSVLFGERLHKQIMEALSLGEVADIPPRDTLDMILAFLLAELTCGAWSYGMSEERFLSTCQMAYRKTKKALDAAATKRKKAEQKSRH